MEIANIKTTILDYITELYKANYVGYFEVFRNGNSYTLELGIPTYMERTSISCDSETDEGFIDFVKEELRSRNYMRLYIYKVIRENDKREQ